MERTFEAERTAREAARRAQLLSKAAADAQAAKERAKRDAEANRDAARRYWRVCGSSRYFQHVLIIYGTEYEMQAYMDAEFGGADERHTGNYTYIGASDADMAAADKLGMPRYIAPRL